MQPSFTANCHSDGVLLCLLSSWRKIQHLYKFNDWCHVVSGFSVQLEPWTCCRPKPLIHTAVLVSLPYLPFRMSLTLFLSCDSQRRFNIHTPSPLYFHFTPLHFLPSPLSNSPFPPSDACSPHSSGSYFITVFLSRYPAVSFNFLLFLCVFNTTRIWSIASVRQYSEMCQCLLWHH